MRKIHWVIVFGALLLIAGGLHFGTSLAAPDLDCRFGITAPSSIVGYESKFDELHACSFLNWGDTRPGTLPGDVEYVHMLRVKDADYPDVLADLSDLLSTYPGAIWAVGNEPDTCHGSHGLTQDCVTPETYAARFETIASQIRSEDPTATILFGNIVQPTPVRLRYLERAWEELISLAGGESEAAGLIDVWSIHSFILNEWVGEAGTGVPLGFDCETDDSGSPYYGKCWDAGDPPDPCTADTCWDINHYDIEPTGDPDNPWDIPETHDNSIFNARIEDMRQWMLDQGERDKPLWITEYGSLLPPEDPEGGDDLVNVTDAETAAFMTGTFDYLRTATDASTGYAADGNRLVQRWYWYSLNEHRYVFGGTLYDPDNGKARTLVGDEWVAYIQALLPEKATVADFDGDGDTDVSVFRPSNGRWYVFGESAFYWGVSTDVPIPADYDGDRTSEAAVYRPSNGRWYVRGQSSIPWGMSTDIPVPCDYDGDGDDDIAVFRPSIGRWYVRNQFSQTWGLNGDYPLPGDYDGDGSCELAVYRPSNGRWYIYGGSAFYWGTSDDIPLPGDYDGDGDLDAAVFRPSNGRWYVRGQSSVPWGLSTDIPVPGDYDGDGDTDIGVFRPSSGKWYIRNQFSQTYGLNGDFPLPARDYNGDADPYK